MAFGSKRNQFCKTLPSACYFVMKLGRFLKTSCTDPLMITFVLISLMLSGIACFLKMRYNGLKNVHRVIKRNYMAIQFAVFEMKARRRAYLVLKGVIEACDNRREAIQEPVQEQRVACVAPTQKRKSSSHQLRKMEKKTVKSSHILLPNQTIPRPIVNRKCSLRKKVSPPKLKVCMPIEDATMEICYEIYPP